MKRSLLLTQVLFALSLLIYTVFSFALTAPNLTLLNWAPYTQFQAWMWSTLFNNRPLLTYVYAAVIAGVFGAYFLLTRQLSSQSVWTKKSGLQWAVRFVLLVSPALLAANALSYDVFNYIFNAKMVAVYHANPHIQVALDFATDPWVRFMHNTHTPAPYGYGWTILSLLPYMMSGGKFLLAWFSFRLMSLVSVGWLGAVLWTAIHHDTQRSPVTLALVFLNPLVVIEVIGNFHNDLWMMAPAVWSLVLIQPGAPKTWTRIAGSLALLVVSISIKLASLALVPLWVVLLTSDWHFSLPVFQHSWRERSQLLKTWWPVLASGLMFLPLLTARSQQFHPWYLTWVLAWMPLFPRVNNKWLTVWQAFIWTLSVTSLLRYLPYLWQGNFTPEVVWHQKLITWIPALLVGLVLFFSLKRRNPA